MSNSLLCLRCERREYTPYGEEWEPGDPARPALSRVSREEDDAPIYVCTECGVEEAMQDTFGGGATLPEEWPVDPL